MLDFYKLVLALINNSQPDYLANLFTTSYFEDELNFENLVNIHHNQQELINYLTRLINELIKVKTNKTWEEYIHELKLKPVLSVLWELRVMLKPWKNYPHASLSDEESERKIIFYKKNLDLLFEKLTTSGDVNYLTLHRIEEYLRIMIFTKQDSRKRAAEITEDVRIVCMTIHKAKGLEFHTVIMPYNEKNIRKEQILSITEVLVLDNNKIGFTIKLQDDPGERNFSRDNYLVNDYFTNELVDETALRVDEETRILYVALTRAIKRFVYFEKDSNSNLNWQQLIGRGGN